MLKSSLATLKDTYWAITFKCKKCGNAFSKDILLGHRSNKYIVEPDLCGMDQLSEPKVEVKDEATEWEGKLPDHYQ